MTTKHHDGFLLFPSSLQNPHREPNQQCTDRDIVGELTRAVTKREMKMGLYYSGGFDWSFDNEIHPNEYHPRMPQTKEYAHYIDTHLRELILKYQPSILWNDIGWPKKESRLLDIIAKYFNEIRRGLINDRFQIGDWGGDFMTPEYTQLRHISEKKWETNRGVGLSKQKNKPNIQVDLSC